MKTITNNYYNQYYGLILLPFGIGLYLLIKFGSDFSISNKALIIKSGFYTGEYGQTIETNSFIAAIKKMSEKNDKIHIIKGLPIRLDEMNFGSINLKDNFYFAALLNSNKIAKLHNNMLIIKDEESCYKSFAARMFYDKFINHGIFYVNNSDNSDKFLYKNNIIASRNLEHKQLLRFDRYGKINIVNFNLTQNKILENKKHIFATGNSLLFLSFLNDLISVVNC
jgi:hypothetical protein